MISNREQRINFGLVYSMANELLVASNTIESFPYKVGRFIQEQSDIRLCSYQKAWSKYRIDMTRFGSESAVLQEYKGAIIIFYNQAEPDYRIRFSIMHEYAHYYLGHEMNLDQTNPKYQLQEVEANCFAAQMLMPEQILRAASKRGYMIGNEYIMKSFGVSVDAAQKRRRTLANYDYEWHRREEKEYDDLILYKYAVTLDRIAPIKPCGGFNWDMEYERQVERESWLDKRTRWS